MIIFASIVHYTLGTLLVILNTFIFMKMIHNHFKQSHKEKHYQISQFYKLYQIPYKKLIKDQTLTLNYKLYSKIMLHHAHHAECLINLKIKEQPLDMILFHPTGVYIILLLPGKGVLNGHSKSVVWLKDRHNGVKEIPNMNIILNNIRSHLPTVNGIQFKPIILHSKTIKNKIIGASIYSVDLFLAFLNSQPRIYQRKDLEASYDYFYTHHKEYV